MVYPLAKKGRVIGVPYEGSHTLFGNWESDNAVDIAAPYGTPVYAVDSGTVGPQIGALGSSDPHLAGLRVHLVTQSNEFYYQHLSRLVVHADEKVQAGQLIGYSGSANGVNHLHFASLRGDPRGYLSAKPDPRQQQPAAREKPVVPDVPAPPDAPTFPDVARTPTVITPAVLPTVDDTASFGPVMNEGPPILTPAQVQPSFTPPSAQWAQAWQLIAQQPFSSPESQGYASLVQSASGG